LNISNKRLPLNKKFLRNFIYPIYLVVLIQAASASAVLSKVSAEESSATPSSPKSYSTDQSNPSPSQQKKKGLDEVISLDLRNMNIQDVFKYLASKGDLNIVTSKNVSGKASLTLNNVSIRDALEIILLSNDLAYIEKAGNIIYIMTNAEYEAIYGRKFMENLKVKILRIQYARPSYVFSVLSNLKSSLGKVILDEDTGSIMIVDTQEKIDQLEKVLIQLEYKLQTKTYPIKYADPADIEAKLKSRLDAKSVGTIQADTRSKQVIISALPERLKEVEELISQLDKPTKVVLIETRILSIKLEPTYEMGIDWEGLFGRLNMKSKFPAGATSNVGVVGYGNLQSDNNVIIELKALEQVQDVKLLANPRITVIDSQEASIHIGDKLAYTTSTTTTGTSTSTTAESVTFVDVGIKLNVVPKINDDGYINISIKPEISSKTGDFISESTKNKFPLINTTTAETNVLVKDGTTIIIGGLRKDERTHIVSGVPILKRIPLLGALFRYDKDAITKQEIAIFLTPHIITPDVDYLEEDTQIKQPKEEKQDVYIQTLNLLQSRQQPKK